MKTPNLSAAQLVALAKYSPQHTHGTNIDPNKLKTAAEFLLAKANKTPPNHGITGKPAHELWHRKA